MNISPNLEGKEELQQISLNEKAVFYPPNRVSLYVLLKLLAYYANLSKCSWSSSERYTFPPISRDISKTKKFQDTFFFFIRSLFRRHEIWVNICDRFGAIFNNVKKGFWAMGEDACTFLKKQCVHVRCNPFKVLYNTFWYYKSLNSFNKIIISIRLSILYSILNVTQNARVQKNLRYEKKIFGKLYLL